MTNTIPVTISEEAAARVTELNMQRAFEQMLEHAREMVPALRRIEVVLEDNPADPSDDPKVVLYCYRPILDPEHDRVGWDWIRWCAHTFPPEVLLTFLMHCCHEPTDGR